MKVILNSASGKSLEFTCKDVDYTVDNCRLTKAVFHNPSINIPDCFTLSEVKSFEDDGSVLTINLR